MRTLIRIGLLLGIVPGLAAAEVLDHLPEAERGTAWFRPSLTVDERPICAEVLKAEQAQFFAPAEPPVAPAGLIKIFAGQDALAPDPSAVLMEGYLPQIMLTLPDKTRAYLQYTRNPGCGGGCETQNVIVSRQPIAADQMEIPREEQSPRATPASAEWLLYKAGAGEFYVWGKVQEHARVYRVASADSLELACDVVLKPAAVAMPPALQEFLMAANELAPLGGDCGSLGTHWRWRSVRGEAGYEALYRPWGIGHRWPGFIASIRGHDAIETSLRRWSLGGVLEYRAFIAYERSVPPALAALADIYAERFGWPLDRSQEMAAAALAATMSVSFGFYLYEPYAAKGEMNLRQAILSHAAIDEIRAIDIDVEAVDRANEDSVLNVAIEYPAALSYLLSKGFDPNTANAFGKTPLMYAAQYNQLESAKLLLAAGADPNAATLRPSDSCAYRMSSSGVTPVHYAVRYASPAMIELLIGNGAIPFSAAENDGAVEYPLDRLKIYAGASAKERNPHIEQDEIALLERQLKVPSDAERQQVAATHLIRARSEYARGNWERAYQHMRAVLLAEPDNGSALADLPLMALRAGYIGPAMAAAQHATDTFEGPSALAAAWFNKGLVCEHPAARKMFYFNEASCDHDVVEPFIKALRLQPTQARASKLTALFKEGGGACLSAKGPRSKAYLITRHRDGNGQRIYMLHSSSETIDPTVMQWRLDTGGAMTVPTYPQVSDRLALGDRTLTMLDHERHGKQLFIDGQACEETP